MARLVISLLGPMQVHLDGQVVTFSTNKVRALLAYLVVESDRAHSREVLAELLWPDREEAGRNLTGALTELRKAIGNDTANWPFLIEQGDLIQFNPNSDCELDSSSFEALLEDCENHSHRQLQRCKSCVQRLEQAVRLYRGDFLEGLTVKRASPRFDEWVLLKGEYFHRRACETLANLALHNELLQRYEPAEAHARRWISLSPFDEDAYCLVMRVLAFRGQRRAALDQYELLRRIMKAEGLEPEPEPATTVLYKEIRAGMLPLPVVAMHNLPTQTTRFIGREQELPKIAALLEAPQYRLITLLGSGGIGKTRLAIQAADDQKGIFADGICFVSCVSVQSPEVLVPTIAQALDFALEGPADPTAQLLNHLQSKELLLVLDNLEHLLHPGTALVDLLTQIQRWAPHVTILATSRERLDLKIEQPVYVEGLEVPSLDHVVGVESFSAVQLFVERAQRVQPGFVLQDENRTAIVNICRLLEGMPLAIELAANWVRSIPIDRIEKELTEGLQLLHTSQPDVPERHRSMRYTFDHSYRMLSTEEQCVFRRLSVFRGGFTLQAAEHVAGTTLPVLASLVDKSLLRWKQAEERYDLHELVRQYAEERLQEAGEFDGMLNQHLEYYCELAELAEQRIRSAEQLYWLSRLDTELDNLRAAITWGQSTSSDVKSALRLVGALRWFWYFSNLWYEADQWTKGVLARTEANEHPGPKAWVLFSVGGVEWLQGDNRAAYTHLKASTDLFRQSGDVAGYTYASIIIGFTQLAQGNFAQAQMQFEESVGSCRILKDNFGLIMALHGLGEVTLYQGDTMRAQALFMETIAIAQDVNPTGLPYLFNLTGRIARYQGDFETAREQSLQGLALSRKLKTKRFAAQSLYNLAWIAQHEDDNLQAGQYFAESVRLYVDVGDKAGIAECIEGFARAQNLLKKSTFAAWLLGAVEALRENIHVPIPPIDRTEYDRTVSAIGSFIDESTLVSVWEKGRMTPIEHVIAVVIGKAKEPDI